VLTKEGVISKIVGGTKHGLLSEWGIHQEERGHDGGKSLRFHNLGKESTRRKPGGEIREGHVGLCGSENYQQKAGRGERVHSVTRGGKKQHAHYGKKTQAGYS